MSAGRKAVPKTTRRSLRVPVWVVVGGATASSPVSTTMPPAMMRSRSTLLPLLCVSSFTHASSTGTGGAKPSWHSWPRTHCRCRLPLTHGAASSWNMAVVQTGLCKKMIDNGGVKATCPVFSCVQYSTCVSAPGQLEAHGAGCAY